LLQTREISDTQENSLKARASEIQSLGCLLSDLIYAFRPGHLCIEVIQRYQAVSTLWINSSRICTHWGFRILFAIFTESTPLLFWAQLAISNSCRQCSRLCRHVSKSPTFSVVWHAVPKTPLSAA